jgi:transcription elongation factor
MHSGEDRGAIYDGRNRCGKAIKKITFEDQPREKMPISRVRKGFEHSLYLALLTAIGDKTDYHW